MTHPRLRPQTFRRTLARLLLLPIAAGTLCFAYIGAFNPTALHGTVQHDGTVVTEYAWR